MQNFKISKETKRKHLSDLGARTPNMQIEKVSVRLTHLAVLKRRGLVYKKDTEKSEKLQILRTCGQHTTINISRLLDYQRHSNPSLCPNH